MLYLSRSLSRPLRQPPHPKLAPTQRPFHSKVQELILKAKPPRFEACSAMSVPDPLYQPVPGPDLKLTAAVPDQDAPARSFFDAPPYRAGDGENAIKVCMQACAVITLQDGSPPTLKVLDPSTPPPDSCCKLPGMRSSGFQTQERAQIRLEVALDNTLPLHSIPPALLDTFWASLPASMSREGQTMFAHFNAGLPPPATATECYQRLQSYVKWLWRLAD